MSVSTESGIRSLPVIAGKFRSILQLTALRHAIAGVAIVGGLSINVVAQAAPEEIVVFADEFEKPGEVSYQLHLNLANRSRKTPDYPGEQPPNRIFRVMSEIAWGLSPTWNLGLHVPMSYDVNLHRSTLDGVKVRLTNLQVAELQDGASWFYGANYELSYYNHRLSESRWVAELRGILGWRNADWMLAINPILNRPLSNVPGVDNHANLDVFTKAMRTVAKDVALGVEHYAELGYLRKPEFGSGSGQTTYAVIEFAAPKGFDVHLGYGHGWSSAVDRRVFKAIIGFPF